MVMGSLISLIITKASLGVTAPSSVESNLFAEFRHGRVLAMETEAAA